MASRASVRLTSGRVGRLHSRYCTRGKRSSVFFSCTTVYSARITRSDELTRPPLQLLTHYRTDSKPVPHLSPRTDARCHYTAANATNGARLRARPSRAGNVGKVGTRENPIDARRKMHVNVVQRDFCRLEPHAPRVRYLFHRACGPPTPGVTMSVILQCCKGERGP